jgi:hypothetical protein
MVRRQLFLPGLVCVGLVIILAIVVHRYIIEAEELSPAASASIAEAAASAPATVTPEPTGDSEDAPRSLTVVTAGSLERFVEGQWFPVAAGARLAQSDRIRTTAPGRVVVASDDGARIELINEVDVSVSLLARSLTELELRQGRVRADLGEGSDVALRIRSSGAVAEGRGGAFTVFADGAGMVAVASETATVRLEAQDHEVAVLAGQQSVVQPGAPPSDPEAIPGEVFLHVAWPEERLRRDRRVVVRGRVDPGTVVAVGDRRPHVAGDGSFEVEVELDAGVNQIAVSATDPSGRSHLERSPSIEVRNRPPRLEVSGEGLWQQ